MNILNGVNLNLNYGDSVSITGESGSGKSTLLNMIGGLDNLTSGSIKIDDIEISNLSEEELAYFRNKKIGFIFQSHYLLEEFNAVENVMIPFLIDDFDKKRQKRAENFLKWLVSHIELNTIHKNYLAERDRG